MRFRRRAFNGIEVALLDCTNHVFERHVHDEFVIGANVVGDETISLDRRSFEASVDDVTLYNPGQVQASTGHGYPWAFYTLYLSPAVMASLCGGDDDLVFDVHVLDAAPVAARLRAACAVALAPETAPEAAEERIALALAELVRHASTTPSAADPVGDARLGRVAAQLVDQLDAPPTLGDLAATHGFTRVQLVRAFTRTYGLPPFGWVNQQRLGLARARLARGDKPARIAADLGFADQAHLTRRFKAAFGVPPSRWARG